jgi:YD repeat-containing protein
MKYDYDNIHRLVSATDPKGQKYLVNTYDQLGKVVEQEHGSGTFSFDYVAIGESNRGLLSYRTTCTRKNGSQIVLEHNEAGNVVLRQLYVRKESLGTEDISGISNNNVSLVTKLRYNMNFELISQILPAGNNTEWIYSENEENPLAQGNLMQVTEIPADGVGSDQPKIITHYEYESTFQFVTKYIDPRGNKTSYEYDEMGNLVVTTYPSVTIQKSMEANESQPHWGETQRMSTNTIRWGS